MTMTSKLTEQDATNKALFFLKNRGYDMSFLTFESATLYRKNTIPGFTDKDYKYWSIVFFVIDPDDEVISNGSVIVIVFDENDTIGILSHTGFMIFE